MLLKLETAYLAILRVAVLVFATVLLVGIVLFGFASLKVLKSAPVAEPPMSVQPQDVLKALLAPDTSAHAPSAASSERMPRNPREVNLTRAAAALASLLKAATNGQVEVQNEKLLGGLRAMAVKESTPELADRFAQGLAENLEGLSTNPALIKLVDPSDPGTEIEKILDEFSSQFNRNVANQQTEIAARRQEYLDEKEQGLRGLYLAGGALSLFLILLFLLVFIRIERNLRASKLTSVAAPVL